MRSTEDISHGAVYTGGVWAHAVAMMIAANMCVRMFLFLLLRAIANRMSRQLPLWLCTLLRRPIRQ